MTPELLRGVPQWAIVLGLIGTVAVAVLILSGVVFLIGGAVRGASSTEGPTMAESAEPLLRARHGIGKFDAKFDRFAQGTQLGLDGESAVGWILLVGSLFAAIVYVFTFNLLSDVDSAILSGGAALIGGAAVYLVLYSLRNRRRRAIQEQLPDGCFQLARSLRSGLALPEALRETSNYLPSPISGLFARLASALALGESTRPALRRAARDAELTEFDLFAEVLAMNAESGGNLPAMLDRLAASIRDRNQFRGYFRSVTALSRTAAIFLAIAPPIGLLLYALFPEQRSMLVRFLRAEEGHYILLAAIVLEVIGLIWIALLLRRRDEY